MQEQQRLFEDAVRPSVVLPSLPVHVSFLLPSFLSLLLPSSVASSITYCTSAVSYSCLIFYTCTIQFDSIDRLAVL